MTALALAGWLPALVLAAALITARRRLALVADAEHELRGSLTSLALALDPGQIDLLRARAALDDLAAARGAQPSHEESSPVASLAEAAARRGVELDWRAGDAYVRATRGRLAQVLCNLVANAVEHGGGRVVVRGRRIDGGVRIEVADSGRGRGLGIVTRAVREAGGRVSIASGDEGSTVAVELPLAK